MKFKNILILYKQSAYTHYFSGRKTSAGPFKKSPVIAERFINTHLEHYRTLARVENFLKSHGVKYRKVQRGRQLDLSKYDLIVTVGGDGTFLEGAAHVKSQLMLGINSDPKWSVGRFCTANNANFSVILEKVITGHAKIRSLNRMKVVFLKSKRFVLALNDILVCHRNPAAMSRYYLEFKGIGEEQRSSGIWIATAAGSTGAIRSAGGKVLPEHSNELQFVARELYCSKDQKPLYQSAVFNEQTHVKILSLMTSGIVYVDGSHNSIPFPFGEEITIQNSLYPLNLAAS